MLARSDQISRSVMSDSLQLHEPQDARPPCPSATPGVHPNPRPSSQWCHPAISSSVIPFSSRLQSFPASESFQMSQFFPSGGQSIRASASASILPMNTQDWSPLGLTGWISLQSNRLSRVFSNKFHFWESIWGQWKHDNSKSMGCSKRSSKREVYSNTILPQETRKT